MKTAIFTGLPNTPGRYLKFNDKRVEIRNEDSTEDGRTIYCIAALGNTVEGCTGYHAYDTELSEFKDD